MARIPLLGGAYQARSIIAAAQRSVNLYPERNPREGSPPVPVTHYQTPGLRIVSTAPIAGRVRALYRATDGKLYAVINGNVYYVSSLYQWVLLGTLPIASSPVNLCDNGIVIVLVDGSYGGIQAGVISAGGSGYVDGTYYGIPLTGGIGSGAEAKIVVAGGAVTSVVITDVGTRYVAGNTLSVDNTDLGGTGSGFSYLVTQAVSTFGYAIDMDTRDYAAISDPRFFGGRNVVCIDTYFIFNKPNTNQFYISLANATFDMLTGERGAIYDFSILTVGSNYNNGTFLTVPLTGGSGTGATATITVTGGHVSKVAVKDPGAGYIIGDVLETTNTAMGTGGILTGAVTNGGTGYTTGTYTNVPLTGGSGTGATADIIVSGGAVTSVAIVNNGTAYQVGNTLSASSITLGGGSGFVYTVATVVGGFSVLVSGVHGTAFDPLDIAGKTGGADNIVTVAANHGELWLIGELTSEIWANTGAADFTFGRIQGAFVDHGCAAPYSLAQADVSLFWLTQDRQGEAIVVKTAGYGVDRISTHAIEQDIQSYSRIDDATGYVHQMEGHAFYVLTFPTADKTWCYELSTGQWHERGSLDGNGNLGRHRGSAFAFAYGSGHVGDFQNGRLFVYDQNYFEDGDQPIPRIRTFPHVVNDGKRTAYRKFTADIEVGQTGGFPLEDPPMISLRWSDNRGATYGNAVMQSMGASGDYLCSPQWSRLGIARDRVFELSWSAPVKTSLNGAWIEAEGAET